MSARRIDQQMAGHAATIIGTDLIDGELRTRYRQLPTLMRGSGFAAAYATILSRVDDKPVGRAYAAVAEGLRAHLTGQHLIQAPRTLDVLPALEGLSAAQYARISAEARTLVGWLSRLAEATFQASGGAKKDNP